MNVKLDENMPADLAQFLRDEGHDAETVYGEGLGGEQDVNVLRAAGAENRILMTFDLDFADVRHYPPGQHAGIVVFRLRDQRWATLEEPVRRLLETGGLDSLKNGLTIVEETQLRVRRPEA